MEVAEETITKQNPTSRSRTALFIKHFGDGTFMLEFIFAPFLIILEVDENFRILRALYGLLM
ncbi:MULTISPECIES: hypothetical protein [Metabacillus]|uniref:Uncharacterized protein n=2 Tax=Metabacillus TaxID=2675233 RepID=A0A179T026_9BACI|nr:MULTISPECIES: hypothetical protein [Metabacillus]OAS86858.1 hypothetical protein A6K24_04995 [Metabacillus litoralis]QNF26073.1 hypothetical protein HUW50_17210 [Metabacillus sp. KUDC1714]